ncbi:MAG: type III pantothenate kinase [Deltaproteobacteria bacterium]|nr:type III pantothenate kinase [Deltaproteobacteria bacterium]
MLLVIDIGNTSIAFGLYKGKELAAHFRMGTLKDRGVDEYAVFLRSLISSKGISLPEIKDGIISCVVPPLLETMKEVCKECFGMIPLVVGDDADAGIPILYDYPREVGADRIVNAVAGYYKYPQPLIIIDFGTATTFDCVSSSGEYLGGAISPGIAISAEALFQRTSKLPRVDIAQPPTAIGKNTVASIQSGLFFGYVSLVEGMVMRIKDEMRTSPLVIATGGQAELIAHETDVIKHVEPNLTLEGLRLIYERSRKTDS